MIHRKYVIGLLAAILGFGLVGPAQAIAADVTFDCSTATDSQTIEVNLDDVTTPYTIVADNCGYFIGRNFGVSGTLVPVSASPAGDLMPSNHEVFTVTGESYLDIYTPTAGARIFAFRHGTPSFTPGDDATINVVAGQTFSYELASSAQNSAGFILHSGAMVCDDQPPAGVIADCPLVSDGTYPSMTYSGKIATPGTYHSTAYMADMSNTEAGYIEVPVTFNVVAEEAVQNTASGAASCNGRFGNVYFKPNSSALNAKAKKQIRKVVKQLKVAGCSTVTLKGVTAYTVIQHKPFKSWRLALAKKRTAAVKKFLSKQAKKAGLEITVKRVAQDKKKLGTKPSDRWLNRKVEVWAS